jgi:hypothetical protein
MTPDHPPPRAGTLAPRVRRALVCFASLRLAVVLLSLFALCLAGATWVESAGGARAARALVYRAWWFDLLLGLLAVNVVGAAVKKYPWRRHQAGFLLTHAGLLVLLLGGLLTALFGVEGQMVLVDTPDPALQARLGLGDTGALIHLDGLHRVEVLRLRRPAGATAEDAVRLVRAVDAGLSVPEGLRGWVGGEWSFDLNPGVFPWASDEYATRRLPWALDLLDRLASPSPAVTHTLGRATLTLTNFYPHAEDDPHHPLGLRPRDVRPGAEGDSRLTPALRGTLSAGGREQDFAVGLSRSAARVLVGGEMYLVRYRPAVRPVPFTLTLRRARQVNDPGSDRPASFQSDVTLTAPGGSRDYSVSMNNTLGHGPYKVYQANYRRLTDDHGQPLRAGGRPVSLSGLSVAHDPGLWLKYAGSLTVVAGIVTMFWMKAYFFRPRGG